MKHQPLIVRFPITSTGKLVSIRLRQVWQLIIQALVAGWACLRRQLSKHPNPTTAMAALCAVRPVLAEALRKLHSGIIVICYIIICATITNPAQAQNNDWENHTQAAADARVHGDFEQTEAYLQKAIGAAEHFPPNDTRLPSTWNDLARVYIAQKKYALAEPLYKHCLAFFEKYAGPNSLDAADSMTCLADLYRLEGKFTEAEPFYKKALSIHEKTPVGNSANLGTVLNNLGLLYLQQHKYTEAEQFFKRALVKRQTALGSSSILVAETLQNYAEVLMDTERKQEAKAMLKQAREILAQP